MTRCFLPGWLVVAVLAVNIGLYLVMIFGTLAHLSELAEGAEPFDLRPLGYGVGDARALLQLLGEEGRAYYARVQLALDTVYPATYALSRGLVLWWLTAPGRLGARPIPIGWRAALLILPLLAAGFDYVENARIATMLAAGPDVGADIVNAASMATRAKSLLSVATEATIVALLIRWWWWRRARRAQ